MVLLYSSPRKSLLIDNQAGLFLYFFRLFNVTSTFDENLYTTPLDKGSLSMEQRAHAERMAAEIEGKSSSNIHMREAVSYTHLTLPTTPYV